MVQPPDFDADLASTLKGHRGVPAPTLRPKKYSFLWLVALPLAFYFIPVLLGFSWNALGGPNPLNPSLPPTDGYKGRSSSLPITAEAWGASVVNVPLQARLRDYLFHHELPLWNPYQGLGQPFAAQGDGSPYFPFAILRALVPYSLGNYITFLLYYLSGIFLYLFLRGVGISKLAAVFGGSAYVISGALSVHVARANIADQLCMIPVLFWSAAKAMRERRVRWYAIVGIASALNTLGGFIQIAMLAGVVLVAFCAAYIWMTTFDRRKRVRELLLVIGAFILGNSLAAFELFPMIHAFRTAFSKNEPALQLAPLPFANVIAFFLPTIFGHPLDGSWVPESTSWTVDWSNLFAYSGITLLLLCVMGYTVGQWRSRIQRGTFLFFTMAALFLLLRYQSVAPFDIVNLLPILGMQTPKHATGIIVFCLTVAAAIGVDHVHQWNESRGLQLIVVTFSCLLLLLARLLAPQIMGIQDLAGLLSKESVSFLGITLAVSMLVVGALKFASAIAGRSADAARALLIMVTIAELSLYIPLGTKELEFLYVRLGLTVLIVIAGLELVLGRHWRAGGLCTIALMGYAWVVNAPNDGLPGQFQADAPPPYMRWLKGAAGDQHRTFGIFPDSSALAGIQDLSAVGPLAPRAFLQMVRTVGNESIIHFYERSTEFMLFGTRDFPLSQYRKTKAIFDWLSIRYLVLDHVYFNPGARTDDRALLSGTSDIRIAYRDRRVTVLESLRAEPKAFFAPSVAIYPSEQAILAHLKTDPESIFGPPMVERSAWWSSEELSPPGPLNAIPVHLDRYAPNQVQLTVNAPSRGIAVLKDADDPGWSATINGATAVLTRVNGMVRGVVIPGAGHYVIRFVYRPPGFIQGIWLAGLAAGLIVLGLITDFISDRTPIWLLGPAALLAAITAAIVLYIELAPIPPT